MKLLGIRFHGRGGQGMKTASRILGTAAFCEGLFAQDSPIYGAERRGAPMVAFTRVSDEPVLERGYIRTPDLVLTSDASLLKEEGAGVTRGVTPQSLLFVNSSRPSHELAAELGLACRVHSFDVTSLAREVLGRPVVSAALAAIAARMTGWISDSSVKIAVEQELGQIGLSGDVLSKNVQLAMSAFHQPIPVHCVTRRSAGGKRSVRLAELRYAGAYLGAPSMRSLANAGLRHTGGWRLNRPVIDLEKCSACDLCYIFCPEGCVTLDGDGKPHIDYEHCKGCLICGEVCPLHAIQEEVEVES